MKNSILLLISIFYAAYLYTQNSKWDINGNNSGINDFIGTTNSQALIFKTENSVRLKITPTGNVVVKDLESNGIGLVRANENGKLGKVELPNNPTYFLDGTGNFSPLINLVGWTANSTIVTVDKKVGIGTSNPNHQLDVKGTVNIDGFLHVDSVQVGDSSLHFSSTTGFGAIDPITGLPISGTLNEIYSDPNPLLGPDQGGQLFINRRANSPGTRLNCLNGTVSIGTAGLSTSLSHKLYVFGTQRTQAGNGSTLSFIDITPSAASINTSIEIGSRTSTGQIDFKGGSNLSSDFKGRLSYTDGVGFNFFAGGGSSKMSIQDNGNIAIDGRVIIGSAGLLTTPGTYKLYVEGGVLTEHVKVALHSSADWMDKVFEPNYQLLSLDSVETYVDNHCHLPGIPSADELVLEGIDVAKMDALLLQKIEELTLYVIKLKKEIEVLKGDKQ